MPGKKVQSSALFSTEDRSTQMQRFGTCPCCESTHFSTLWKNDFPRAPLNATEFMYGGRKFIGEIMQCTKCNFHFINNPIPGDDFYRNASSEGYQSLTKARLKYFSKIKSSLINHKITLERKSKILDVGAGQGDWLSSWPEIKNRFATELQPKFIEEMQKKGLSIIPSLEEAGDLFDMISAFDYLEHVLDPSELLKNLASKITPNGSLIIGVPNMGNFIAHLLGTRYYLYCPMHYSYFTSTSLRKILSLYFKNVEIVPSPPMYTTANGVAKWVTPSLSHPLLDNVWLPIGYSASLIAIAKEPI